MGRSERSRGLGICCVEGKRKCGGVAVSPLSLQVIHCETGLVMAIGTAQLGHCFPGYRILGVEQEKNTEDREKNKVSWLMDRKEERQEREKAMRPSRREKRI